MIDQRLDYIRYLGTGIDREIASVIQLVRKRRILMVMVMVIIRKDRSKGVLIIIIRKNNNIFFFISYSKSLRCQGGTPFAFWLRVCERLEFFPNDSGLGKQFEWLRYYL